jgi:hypothetical protein
MAGLCRVLPADLHGRAEEVSEETLIGAPNKVFIGRRDADLSKNSGILLKTVPAAVKRRC